MRFEMMANNHFGGTAVDLDHYLHFPSGEQTLGADRSSSIAPKARTARDLMMWCCMLNMF